MKSIIIVTLIAGLTGCHEPPSLTANQFSELSNEDLCRALGTYNNDGESVFKIYDELKKRPEKIDSERCYILEKISQEQYVKYKETNTGIITPYTNDMNTIPLYTDGNYHQYIDPQHHKTIHNPRKNNKSDENNKTDTDYLEKINLLNRTPIYKNEFHTKEQLFFGTRGKATDKIDMKDEEMSAIMRECLKKHISKPHLNSDK